MRLTLLFGFVLAAAARSSILTSLKTKVMESKKAGSDDAMLIARDFANGKGVISLTVAREGTQVPLPSFLQKATWTEIGEQSDLTKAGFKYWMPQKNGFLFKDKKDSRRVLCVNDKVAVGHARVEMSFSCSELSHQDARFRASPYPIPYRAGINNLMGQGTNSPGMTNSYLPLSSMNSPYAGNQFSTFWMPVTNGSPYGWNDYNWGAFNYDYYAVTPMGYWGCPSLGTSGSCSTNPYYYPFNP